MANTHRPSIEDVDEDPEPFIRRLADDDPRLLRLATDDITVARPRPHSHVHADSILPAPESLKLRGPVENGKKGLELHMPQTTESHVHASLSMGRLQTEMHEQGSPPCAIDSSSLSSLVTHIEANSCTAAGIERPTTPLFLPSPAPSSPVQPCMDNEDVALTHTVVADRMELDLPFPGDAPFSFETLHATPIILSNSALADPIDPLKGISTYRLNSAFDFHSICTSTVDLNGFSALDFQDSGDYVCVRIPSVSSFLLRFHYLHSSALKSIAMVHSIWHPKTATLKRLQSLISVHVCTHECPDTKYVFKRCRRARRSPKMAVFAANYFSLPLSNSRSRPSAPGAPLAHLSEESTAVPSIAQPDPPSAFPFPYIATQAHKNDIIKKWQNAMGFNNFTAKPCAVCGQRKLAKDISEVYAKDLDLTLLQNPYLPANAEPTNYNFETYDRAILYHKGLHSVQTKGLMDICKLCTHALLHKSAQPVDAWANFQYYGHEALPIPVSDAVDNATTFDIMMVARCRTTKITHLYSEQHGNKGIPFELSQQYTKGNIAVIPQDVMAMRTVLPPPSGEISDAMCALFIGSNTKPTRQNIKKLRPVLVSKPRVTHLLNFLLENNSHYGNHVQFSQENMDNLFELGELDNVAVPAAIEICHLPRESRLADTDFGYTCRDTEPAEVDGHSEGFVLEAVAYSDGGNIPKNHRLMKATALAHCLDHRQFIKVQSGSGFLSDEDPCFLTAAFPHLDPWGIGGFNEPLRFESQKISFEYQVRNMLLQDSGIFQNDPNFAFVCFNILQKKEVNRHICFRTSAASRHAVVSEIQGISSSLSALVTKWEKDPSAKPSNKQEKQAMRTLNKIKMIAKEVKGSTGYKQCRRNEIRGLMRKYSTPALFITLNPADVADPLLAVLAGLDVDAWTAMTAFERGAFVAKHPGPAAVFFDTKIRSFVDIILACDPVHRSVGLFGECTAYYGTVEAQGRGTLHCHMLVWLAGNPSPQVLRDKMADDPTFKKEMFLWIESIVHSHLPGTVKPVHELGGVQTNRPDREPGVPDYKLITTPFIADLSDVEFQRAFRETVGELAMECNWHTHRPTCYKHLKDGEKPSEQNCRMRIDGSTREFTEIDPETESILLRRLHPRINNFNELVLFLMRCNMDIKYIGSGEAAKALTYYITDYITKSQLPTHVGLEAIEYAIKRNDERFLNEPDAEPSRVDRSLFTKTVNAMMARQEMSHQQVMSYIIGGGDFYTSHKFQTLKWGDFDRYIRQLDNTAVDLNSKEVELDLEAMEVDDDERPPISSSSTKTPIVDADEYAEGEGEDPEIVITVDNGVVEAKTPVDDYRYRGLSSEFNSLSVWEHCEKVVKMTRSSDDKRTAKLTENVKAGRKANNRDLFSSTDHPQYATHMSRFRDVASNVIPVLLGPTIPRCDRTPEELERWYRAMLILFKPWRTLDDLRPNGLTWSESFTLYDFPPSLLAIMNNLNVEHECRDARDTYDRKRKEGIVTVPLVSGMAFAGMGAGDIESLEAALRNDSRLDGADSDDETDEESNDDRIRNEDPRSTRLDSTAEKLAMDNRVLVDLLERSGILETTEKETDHRGKASEATAEDLDEISVHKVLMGVYKKQKRPVTELEDSVNGEQRPSKRRKLAVTETEASVDVVSLDGKRIYVHDIPDSPLPNTDKTAEDHLEDIIMELGLTGNPEQERAVRIIGEHFVLGIQAQLLMYIAGVGGTGKSYIIKAIVELFKRCGASAEMLRSAPTGSAAVLIDGYTIHALTFLPKSLKQPADLEERLELIWRGVKWLILDEVSLLSASMLSYVSARMSLARGWDVSTTDMSFGGVNVIFLGDMAQLPPVLDSALYSRFLVDRIKSNNTQTIGGQTKLHGISLWREISTVVVLKQNLRAKDDPAFINLLLRIRSGIAWKFSRKPLTPAQQGDGKNYVKSDYHTLLARQLHLLPKSEVQNFLDAPVVVATKRLRDPINARIIENFAAKTGQILHYYHSIDRKSREELTGNARDRMWLVSSTSTKDNFGKIPLVPGAKVMVTDNIAIGAHIVNGAVGTVLDIKYEVVDGRRFAKCVHVRVPGCTVNAPGLPPDVVPVIPQIGYFTYSSGTGTSYTISRLQLPLILAYAFTAHKSQGRSLTKAVIDLAGCTTAQHAYVMLSRATSLKSLAILRGFEPKVVHRDLSTECKAELARIDSLDEATKKKFESRHTSDQLY